MALSPYTQTVASGAYASATTESYTVSTRGREGIVLAFNVATPASGFSATMSILGVTASGLTYTILAAVAITAAGTQILQAGPGLVAVSNQAISAPVSYTHLRAHE